MLSFSYYKEANSISETEQFLMDMLKSNIDKGNIFEGSMSFVSGDFHLNDENLLQVNDIKPVICEALALDGYNCKDGVLITKLSIDPAIDAIETLRKATASINEVNSVINRLQQIE
jgi:hypothetical protein